MDRSFQESLIGECLEIPSGWWTHNVFGLLQPVLFCYGSDADPWFLLHRESCMTVSQHSYAYHTIKWNCREPGWTLLTRTLSCIGDNHPMSSVVLQSWNAKADFRIEFLRRKRAGRELPACFLIISTTTQSKEKKTSNVNLTVHVVFILVTSTHSRSVAKESSCSRRSQTLQLKFSSHVLCGSRLMSVWCCAGTWLTGHPEWNLSIDCYNWCWLFVTVMFMTINIFWCDAMMCCYDSSLLLIKSMLMSTDDMSWWVFVIDAPTHNTYVQQIKQHIEISTVL